MIKLQRLATVALCCGLLPACVSPQQIQDRQQRFMDSRPVCQNEKQCERMWSAARNWVLSNCLKIQNITDDYMETFGSVGGNTHLACRVTKDPLPESDDGYVLTVTTGCGNILACVPDSWTAAFDFNQTVAAVVR